MTFEETVHLVVVRSRPDFRVGPRLPLPHQIRPGFIEICWSLAQRKATGIALRQIRTAVSTSTHQQGLDTPTPAGPYPTAYFA
jgi:hypothetical protein